MIIHYCNCGITQITNKMQNQLHLLWQKVEENKADCFALAKEVEAKERELATDKALDSQVCDCYLRIH